MTILTDLSSKLSFEPSKLKRMLPCELNIFKNSYLKVTKPIFHQIPSNPGSAL